MNEDNKPVEVKVRNWDGHSFTVEGENHRLEKMEEKRRKSRAVGLMHLRFECRQLQRRVLK